MTRIEVPSETLLVEMGEDGLNILETTMQMSSRDESAPVECDICSKTLGKMKENPDEIMEIVLDSWKSIVDKSETPWALCDECYESIKSKSLVVAGDAKV